MRRSIQFFIPVLVVLFSCRDFKMPEGNVWKGVFHLSTKGDQPAEVSFDFQEGTGIIMLPDIIPIPLDLTEVRKKEDSVFFTIGFRSGPGYCKGVIRNDSIHGTMMKEDLDETLFWLASSTDKLSIVDQPKPPKEEPVVIDTYKGSESEQSTRVMLEEALEKYDLEPYMYTKKIMIQDSVIPHSHPVLTMSTRDTSMAHVLSTFIHEQMHWYTLSRSEASDSAITAFKRMYPDVPVALPMGSGSRKGTYLHILVNYLEYHVLIQVLGKEEATEVLKHWEQHHYTWIYSTVMKDYEQIKAVVEKNGLHFEVN